MKSAISDICDWVACVLGVGEYSFRPPTTEAPPSKWVTHIREGDRVIYRPGVRLDTVHPLDGKWGVVTHMIHHCVGHTRPHAYVRYDGAESDYVTNVANLTTPAEWLVELEILKSTAAQAA